MLPDDVDTLVPPEQITVPDIVTPGDRLRLVLFPQTRDVVASAKLDYEKASFLIREDKKGYTLEGESKRRRIELALSAPPFREVRSDGKALPFGVCEDYRWTETDGACYDAEKRTFNVFINHPGGEIDVKILR